MKILSIYNFFYQCSCFVYRIKNLSRTRKKILFQWFDKKLEVGVIDVWYKSSKVYFILDKFSHKGLLWACKLGKLWKKSQKSDK